MVDGCTAIVTGASRGIGKALAVGLARKGASVVCAARSTADSPGVLPGTVDATASAIVDGGGRAVAARCDIGSATDIAALIEAALHAFGRIDVVVNNAMAPTRGLFGDTSTEMWDESMAVNVRSLFLMAKATVPHLAAAGGGSIINISSGAADPSIRGMPPGFLTYSVAKAALERFSTALAVEVAEHNIAVNALRPGAVKTEMSVHELGEDYDWTGWKAPEAVVPAVCYLAGQDASGTTGRILDSTQFGLTWP